MSTQTVKAKILYVDDDPLLGEFIAFLLEQQGFEVQTANNGAEAVKIVQAWLPDLILMDLMMPVMDGFQATTVLRADPRSWHIPIIALSAYAEEETRLKALAVGMNNFLPKKIAYSDLMTALGAYLPIITGRSSDELDHCNEIQPLPV